MTDPLPWDDADLAALATLTPADLRAALARWRQDAPPWAKALLDAEPVEADG